MKKYLLALCVGWSLFGAVACKSMQSKDDLREIVAKHHIDLRWGRFDNASQTVTPALQKAFVAEWNAKVTNIELQEVDVTGLQVAEAGDAADVFVTITWIDRNSMQVKNSNLQEHWVRGKDGWVADKPAEL